MDKFASRLKCLLNDNNVSTQDAATAANVSVRSLQYYLRSEREPTMSVLSGLANFFNVSVDYLIGLSDDPERR